MISSEGVDYRLQGVYREIEEPERLVLTHVRLNVDGLTQEESLIQPRPGGNCLDDMLPMLGQDPVQESVGNPRGETTANFPLQTTRGGAHAGLSTILDDTSERDACR